MMALKCFMGTSEAPCISISPTKKETIKGTYPSLAANTRGDVVCVYNQITRSRIYDGVGELSGDCVQWKTQNYVCPGDYPNVAINNDRQVVMAYNRSGTIKYRTGTKIGTRITWRKDEYDVCVGRFPSIAMSEDKILLVFQVKKDIHYCFGFIEGNNATISWSQNDANLHVNASYPSVAMNDRFVAVLYNNGSTLLSTIGEITDSTVTWGEVQDDVKDSERMSKNTDSSDFNGQYPSIAMFEDGTVVSTFQRGTMAGRHLFARCGRVQHSTKKIKWHEKKAGCFVHGCYSVVAAVKGQTFMEMHSTNGFGLNGIWFHVCMAA